MILNEIQKRELLYKLETVKQFLIFNNGQEYKLYNHCCPDGMNEPDDDIIGYQEDIEYLVSLLISSSEDINDSLLY